MYGLSEKQLLSLNESTAKINIWEGSVRSGKTYISLWRFLKELTYGPLGEYAMLARTQKNFKETIYPILFNMIGADAKYYAHKTELHIWGKTIHTIGCDNERAESKIRGPTFQGAYVDEVTIIPESVFKMLISRCAMGGAKIFGTTNPDSPYHWLKKDFLDNNPDVKSWRFTLDDNPQLKQEEKDYLKRQYKGLWYQRFVEGRWIQAEGAIYDFFDDERHTIDFPTSGAQSYIVGVDYGTTNPCAFVCVGINPDRHPNLWCHDEYYFDSKIHQRQKTDAEYAEDLKLFIEGKNVQAIYIDPSAASFKAELHKIGIPNLYDAKNEVNDGIRFVSKYLAIGKLKVVKKCKNLIQEFKSYVWDANSAKTGIDKPLKQHDHALDALRYAIFSHFFGRDEQRLSARDLDDNYNEAMGRSRSLPSFFQNPNDVGYRF